MGGKSKNRQKERHVGGGEGNTGLTDRGTSLKGRRGFQPGGGPTGVISARSKNNHWKIGAQMTLQKPSFKKNPCASGEKTARSGSKEALPLHPARQSHGTFKEERTTQSLLRKKGGVLGKNKTAS